MENKQNAKLIALISKYSRNHTITMRDAIRARSRRTKQLRGANNWPGRRATACKKAVHGGEVEAEPGADRDRVGCCERWWS
jgi:hypothetical protein